MGRHYTPTYRIEITTDRPRIAETPWSWKPAYGRANATNLARFLAKTNESFAPGGVNEHAGPLTITSARLVHQATGTVVATAQAADQAAA